MIAQLHGVEGLSNVQVAFEFSFDKITGTFSLQSSNADSCLIEEPADISLECGLRKLGALLWTCSGRKAPLSLRCEWPGFSEPLSVHLGGIVSIAGVEFHVGFKRSTVFPIWLAMRSGGGESWKLMRTTPEGVRRFLDELGVVLRRIETHDLQHSNVHDRISFISPSEAQAYRLLRKHGVRFAERDGPMAFLRLVVPYDDVQAVEIPSWIGLSKVEVRWESWPPLRENWIILALSGELSGELAAAPSWRYRAGGVLHTALLPDKHIDGSFCFLSNDSDLGVRHALEMAAGASMERRVGHYRFISKPKNRIEARWVCRAVPRAQIEVVRMGRYPQLLGAVVGS